METDFAMVQELPIAFVAKQYLACFQKISMFERIFEASFFGHQFTDATGSMWNGRYFPKQQPIADYLESRRSSI
jgi:hypothetical protein